MSSTTTEYFSTMQSSQRLVENKIKNKNKKPSYKCSVCGTKFESYSNMEDCQNGHLTVKKEKEATALDGNLVPF